MHQKSFLKNAADAVRRNVLATTLAASALVGTVAPSFGQSQPKPNAADGNIYTITHPGIQGRIVADTVIEDLAFYYLEKGPTPEKDNTYWGAIADRSEEGDEHNTSYFVKMSKDYADYRQKIKTGKNIPNDPLKALPFAAEELEARSKIYDAIHHNGRRNSVNDFDRAHVFTDPSYGWFLYGNQTFSDVATMQGAGLTIGGETSLPFIRSNKVEQHTYLRGKYTYYFENPDQFNVKHSISNRYRSGTWRYTRIPSEANIELGVRPKPP